MKKLVLLLATAFLAGCGSSADPTSPGIKPPADSLSAAGARSKTAAGETPAHRGNRERVASTAPH